MARTSSYHDRSPRPKREAPLTEEEERRLARLWQDKGDEKALGRLISSHMGLVIRIATELRNSGPALEDLVQEGYLGLTIAARRFDTSRGTRLSTYATYWIRACMLESIVRTHGPVRIGTTRSQRKIFFGMGRARRQLEHEGEVADTEHLAAALGVDREAIDSMAPRMGNRDISLDAPRGKVESRQPFGESFAGDTPTPEDLVGDVEQDSQRRARMREALKVLDPRERALIRARHLRERPATLASLGRQMGVSRERARQLEARATMKLRRFVEGESAAG